MYRQGLILVITGNGKGKTTSALGQAIRALGHGMKVAIIQFMKGSQNYGEFKFFSNYDDKKMFYKQVGRPDFVNRNNPEQIDREMAFQGWEVAKSCLKGDYDFVILDEINVAMDFGLIEINLVLDELRSKPASVTVILTGRGAPGPIMDLANTVSIVDEKKHHYAAGVEAQAGIEY